MRGITAETDERLLVGPGTLDDAGVVDLGNGTGLVQTVDFFPPVVDDPWFYGAIAAANALSDVYAMGGRPLSALCLASFPKGFDDDIAREILAGGAAKVREAGAVLAGGHTVEADLQFGFAVSGLVAADAIVSNAGARAGHLAYLTKPIGMGSLTTAAKFEKIDAATLRPAAEQMATLNAAAAEAMVAAGATACTDVTGYGLVGHAANVTAASGTTLRIASADVPLFPGALELARMGSLSGGAKRGRANLAERVRVADGVEEALVNLLFDAETSGGLLVAITPERAGALETEMKARDVTAVRIGAFEARGDFEIEVE